VATNSVFLFPGFGASDLGILASGNQVWYDASITGLLGIGSLRLAPDGVNPGPPDGLALGVSKTPQNPWGTMQTVLQQQLGSDWVVGVGGGYDWRKSNMAQASELATSIAGSVPPSNPTTLVAHSMGGLICVLAYRLLTQTGQQGLVRRIITMGTPFFGCYMPILWINASLSMMQQLIQLSAGLALVPAFNPAFWTIPFLNNIALTWPAFYECYPSLMGPEAAGDPNRSALYTATNYPSSLTASQAWLDYARTEFQPILNASSTNPPSWVMTCVYATGIQTANTLASKQTPLNLFGLGTTMDGDGIVTAASAQRTGAALVTTSADHFSMPVGLLQSGELAALIKDPRNGSDPTPPPLVSLKPMGQNITSPPEAEDLNPLLCIGGG
jgi:pimeloyl-ACP methyl ester carboxylesterase